jgi:hypothetical protein
VVFGNLAKLGRIGWVAFIGLEVVFPAVFAVVRVGDLRSHLLPNSQHQKSLSRARVDAESLVNPAEWNRKNSPF